MLDIKFVRTNPDIVKQNIKNKFQDSKLTLVDEVLELDKRNREIKQEVEALRAEKNKISKNIGSMMAQGKKDEAETLKKKVTENADRMEALSAEEKEVEEKDVYKSQAIYRCRAVILCTGTYLKARCIYGEVSMQTGPNGLQSANYLTDSLKSLGIKMYRFKTCLLYTSRCV